MNTDNINKEILNITDFEVLQIRKGELRNKKLFSYTSLEEDNSKIIELSISDDGKKLRLLIKDRE